jgi:uncharacterized membrane protein
MDSESNKIEQLEKKLDLLLRRQDEFSQEINNISKEIETLKKSSITNQNENIESKAVETNQEIKYLFQELENESDSKALNEKKQVNNPPPNISKTKIHLDLEKFIGENLINKIGIIIILIGVIIGAKYSIENDLVSPLTRIVMGYITGVALLGVGLKLKKNFENYSAVLVSGAMAIMYFITFAAYSFYGLMPQSIAFGVMVIFTCFTVFTSLVYNQQIIAQLGLVGAYSVPFLLSNGSGKIEILLAYMLLINVGILIISFKKYWKSLLNSSFSFSWLIFVSWLFSDYDGSKHFYLTIGFLTAFFILFYCATLTYKIIRNEFLIKNDVVLILINSFVFYAIGFYVLSEHDKGEQLLGLFTILNALAHFLVSILIYKRNLADKNLLLFIIGLVLTFVTISIPVQLDGKWVTLLWSFEAALLFWIGRTKNISFYEKLSFPLMILAFVSICIDWIHQYNSFYIHQPNSHVPFVFNQYFLTSILFLIAFGFINWLDFKHKNTLVFRFKFLQILTFLAPSILVFTAYYALQIEISTYWNQKYEASQIVIPAIDSINDYDKYIYQTDYLKFKSIWTFIYALFFGGIIAITNIKFFKNKYLSNINLAFNFIVIILFLSQGILILKELRTSYLSQTNSEYYLIGSFNIVIAYITYGFVMFNLFANYLLVKSNLLQINFRIYFDVLLHTSIVWILSSELINYLEISNFNQSNKLGLSILWGVYSLVLIALGIWKKKKHLRIGAIALFSVTLIKLFFYDIAHLDTISKTIVFVSLGILLLIISFLYNKYKNLIIDESEN